jgi:hypothetical protein
MGGYKIGKSKTFGWVSAGSKTHAEQGKLAHQEGFC